MSTDPNESLKKAIEIIKKNKEFFAEYLKRERDLEHLEQEGDLREGDEWETAPKMMPYIFQWEETLKTNKKTYDEYYQAYRTFRHIAKDILTKNSTPASATLQERAINRTVEHNNAFSETIKGALYSRNNPGTQEPGFIRPHDYLWRYQANNRLDTFLQDMPEFVNFIIENEAAIDKLGNSYKQWWLIHKRQALRSSSPPQAAEDQARKNANALQLKSLWHYGDDAPPMLDKHGKIIPVICFKRPSRFKVRSETEEFVMRLVFKEGTEIKFSDFQIIGTTDGCYIIENQKMRTIDELIDFAKTTLTPIIDPVVEETPTPLISHAFNTAVQKEEPKMLIKNIVSFIEEEITPVVQDYGFTGRLDKVLETIQNKCSKQIKEILSSADNSSIASDEDKQKLEVAIKKFSTECKKSTAKTASIGKIVSTLRTACQLENSPAHAQKPPKHI